MSESTSAHVALSDAALDQLFRTARSYYAWLDAPVGDDMLRQLYDLMKWAPTSANLSPVRLLFLRSGEAKRRLVPALAPRNVDKVLGAPVTAIVAYDLKFYEKQPKLLPYNPKMRELFAESPELVETTARRNSSLQGAYMMLAARALGLDCGPISGFDNKKVDDEFFAAGQPCEGVDEEFLPEGRIKSNFLCNLGYGDPARLHERLPRLDFSEACKIL
jgi:3-hydroxypropanoate dehydrogenase